jgi:hypothetical protein
MTTRRINYFSQNRETCGDGVETACGPVSLANSLLTLRASSMPPPSLPDIICLASTPTLGRLRDSFGIGPEELCALSAKAGMTYGLHARVVEPCDVSELEAGDLMYVSSIALKNAQGCVQFEDAKTDSHIVMVERIEPNTITVINPDCRRCGHGFQNNKWGRMHISKYDVDKVWMSTRGNGTHTCKAAVLLRGSSM